MYSTRRVLSQRCSLCVVILLMTAFAYADDSIEPLTLSVGDAPDVSSPLTDDLLTGDLDIGRAQVSPDSEETPRSWCSPEVFRSAGRWTAGYTRSWTKQVEFGGRFLDGNSNEDFLNVAGKFERSNEFRTILYDMGGYWGQASGIRTTNRWFGNVTADINKKGNWLFFLTSKNEYDQFENLDYRGSFSAGPGLRVFNEKHKKLVLRVGPAVTHEVYRDPTVRRTTPDLFGEVEMDWELSDTVEWEHRSTILSSMENTEIVRVVSSGGLLIRLDDGDRWRLKLGVRHEYNSKPNKGRLPSDFISSVVLVYKRK
jgi:putative salt-induced outer membrane protein YdiY